MSLQWNKQMPEPEQSFERVFQDESLRSRVLHSPQEPNQQTYLPNHFQSVFWPVQYQV